MSTDTKYTVKLMNMNEVINLIQINPIMTVYEVFYVQLLILMMNKLWSLKSNWNNWEGDFSETP